jgi:hypothetical protein
LCFASDEEEGESGDEGWLLSARGVNFAAVESDVDDDSDEGGSAAAAPAVRPLPRVPRLRLGGGRPAPAAPARKASARPTLSARGVPAAPPTVVVRLTAAALGAQSARGAGGAAPARPAPPRTARPATPGAPPALLGRAPRAGASQQATPRLLFPGEVDPLRTSRLAPRPAEEAPLDIFSSRIPRPL